MAEDNSQDESMEPPPEEVQEGAPMWIVSYGDMMTLLLCFFILYFQMDVTNGLREIAEKNSLMEVKEKKTISDTRITLKDSKLIISKDATNNVFISKIQTERVKDARATAEDNKDIPKEKAQKTADKTAEKIQALLAKELKATTLKMVLDAKKIELTLPAESYFPRGKAKLHKERKIIFKKIVKSLVKDGKIPELDLEIEGHTDSTPIKGWLSRYFPTNWELSSARAAAVLRILNKYGLKARKYRIIGLADTVPLLPNTSKKNKSLNRRVVVRMTFVDKNEKKKK